HNSRVATASVPTTVLIFDSGLGGLTVFREVAQARPHTRYVYIADDAYFPYAEHGEAELIARVSGLMAELVESHRPDLVVIACNTASTLVLPHLRALAQQARDGARHAGDGRPRIYPLAHSRLCQRQRRRARRLGAARGVRRGGAARRAGRGPPDRAGDRSLFHRRRRTPHRHHRA